jgi:mannose-6-phosphate isomerase-like protein (cupin superfamily)
MIPNISRFVKETAPTGHNGTILAGPVLPNGMNSPFCHAWGYLENASAMEGHAHPTQEIYMVFEGEGFVHIGETKYPVRAGDVVEIPVNVYHTMECENGHKLLWAALWWEN